MKTVLRGEFVPVNPGTIKEEGSQINHLTFYQKLEAKEQTNSKASIKKG